MKNRSTILLCILLAAAQLSVALAYDGIEGSGFIANPTLTSRGIVFTDNYSSKLYLSADGVVTGLASSPGCGNFFSVSPDMKLIGFKLIGKDGLQSPALLNLDSREITRLHASVDRAGQVSFTSDGRTAFTIGNQLIVTRGTNVATYNLGTYANIAPISPDGKFAVYNDANDQLWLIDLSTKERSIITDGKRGYFYPQWASNSTRLLYSSLDGNVSVRDIASRTTYEIGEGYSPSWSADARHIIFYRKEIEKDRVVNTDLYLATFDGSELTRLTNTPDVMEMNPRLIEGDTQVLFHSYDKKELQRLRISDNSTIEKIEVRLLQPSPAQLQELRNAPELKKTTQLDMPYVHQVWDTPDWYNGHSACGPTSSIMVIAYYNLVPKWDVWCSASGPSPGHWSSYGNYVCEQYRYRTIEYTNVAADPNGKNSYGGYGYMWTGSYSPHSRMVSYYTNHGMGATMTDSPPGRSL